MCVGEGKGLRWGGSQPLFLKPCVTSFWKLDHHILAPLAVSWFGECTKHFYPRGFAMPLPISGFLLSFHVTFTSPSYPFSLGSNGTSIGRVIYSCSISLVYFLNWSQLANAYLIAFMFIFCLPGQNISATRAHSEDSAAKCMGMNEWL